MVLSKQISFAAAALSMLLAISAPGPLNGQSPSPDTVLSILDFSNNTGRDDWAWLSGGLADMLVADLARTPLTVVTRDDLAAALDEQALALTGLTEDEALVVGRMTSADALLTGSFSLSGNLLRIDARIVNVATGAVDGSASVEGGQTEVFALEATLAASICGEMNVAPPPRSGNPGTASIPAARTYYEGLALQASGDVEAALARFEAAAELDPLYARPRYSLEESWQLLKDFRRLRQQREVNALWRKAEALEDRLAADPFVSDSDAIIAAFTAGSPTVQIGAPPADDPSLGSCPSPAVGLWNLQITYWEIGSKSAEFFGDQSTEDASLREIVRLADEAEKAWPEDEWLPEILYWKVFAQRWIGDWEAVKTGCERIFVDWPDFRMAWALEDIYEAALEALGS